MWFVNFKLDGSMDCEIAVDCSSNGLHFAILFNFAVFVWLHLPRNARETSAVSAASPPLPPSLPPPVDEACDSKAKRETQVPRI